MDRSRYISQGCCPGEVMQCLLKYCIYYALAQYLSKLHHKKLIQALSFPL